MHADGYAGFEDLYRFCAIREVACMAHGRRKFVVIHRSLGSPIAEEAIGRIAQLYDVETEARGSPPDVRKGFRKAHAAPVFDALEIWLALQRATIPGKSPLAAAIRHALTRIERLRPDLDHHILDLDNNTDARGMRAIIPGQKNNLVVGAQPSGKAAAIAYVLIEKANLNAVDLQGWLAETLARIPDQKLTKVDDLLPWKSRGSRSVGTLASTTKAVTFVTLGVCAAVANMLRLAGNSTKGIKTMAWRCRATHPQATGQVTALLTLRHQRRARQRRAGFAFVSRSSPSDARRIL